MADFRLPSSVLTHLNCGRATLALPPPVTMRSCPAPTKVAAAKHHDPSLTTVADGAMWLAANAAIACRVGGCWLKQAYSGRPSAVVCTAATKGTLFSAPRPVLPPENSPPR